MEIDPAVRAEWDERHGLGRASLHWLAAHADPGDAHPIVTALGVLRSAAPLAQSTPPG